MSSGRQPYLGLCLSNVVPELVFVAGSEDRKFAKLGQEMADAANQRQKQDDTSESGSKMYQLPGSLTGTDHIGDDSVPNASYFEVKSCGHAVHLERPEALHKILMHLLQYSSV